LSLFHLVHNVQFRWVKLSLSQRLE
jgi:hypothetical protein